MSDDSPAALGRVIGDFAGGVFFAPATPPVIPSIIRSPDGALAPSNLTAASGPEGVWLTWTSPSMVSVLQIEIYASASNDCSTATLIASEQGELYFHQLAEDTVRYYWILARGMNGMVST